MSGVGNGSQSAGYDCRLPIAFRQMDGQTVSQGIMNVPTVGNSDLPGLLGLTALRRNRAVLDFEKMQLFFCGPGEYDLGQHLPPGTDSFQCEVAPSGHMVIPCCEFTPTSTADTEDSLTLLSRNPDQQPSTEQPQEQQQQQQPLPLSQ